MKAIEPIVSKTVPKRVLKGKDGREAFAGKIEKAKETLRKHPLPDFITKR